MRVKSLALINIILAGILLVSVFSVNVEQTTSARQYDPWVDYNSDGTVNYLDVYSLLIAYGMSGDPTKNVNVTNFPLDAQGNLRVKVAQGQMQTCNDSVKISLVDFRSDLWLVLQPSSTYTYPFIFNPKAQSFNVTDCSIAYELSAGANRIIQYTMNGVRASPPEPLPDTSDETYYTKQIGQDPRFLKALRSGVNYFTIFVDAHSQPIQINYLALFIEYEYLA